jgi:hypothetical protein
MIPRIQTGTSFKGAALYYLHDKRHQGEAERLTSDRVAWTHAVNTLENDPEAVLAEMRQTALDQSFLKIQAGKRVDGRPTGRTVMTVALAWAPDQQPNQADMIEAGNSFLRHMGWQEHQVLFVAHNDTKHPHVHLIINRVHPETGMTIDDAWSKTRAQKWALSYEREHGRVYCEGREAKYSRDEGRDAQHMTYREWKIWQEIGKDQRIDPGHQRAVEAGEWSTLKDGQRDSRIAFWKETGDLRKQLRAGFRQEVRAEFADKWSEYAKVRATRDQEAKLYDREARRGIRELRRAGNTRKVVTEMVKGTDGRTYRKRRGVESPGIERIKERQKAYHARQREELYQLRAAIAAQQKERLEQLSEVGLRQLSADREKAYQALLASHRQDRKELTKDQAEGERRRDVLSTVGQYRSPTSLTPVQTRAYLEQAREEAARKDGSEARRASTVREAPEQTPVAKEGQEREKTDKEQAQESKRSMGMKWFLAKRELDRKRERGDGGREH